MIPDLRRQCGGSGDAGCTTGGRPPRGLRPAAALVSRSRCPASRGSRLFGAPESPLGQLNGNQASGLKVQTRAALGFVGSGASPFCSSIELLRHSYTKLALVVEGSSRSAECFHDPAGRECEHTRAPQASHVSKACRPYPGCAMHQRYHRINQAARTPRLPAVAPDRTFHRRMHHCDTKAAARTGAAAARAKVRRSGAPDCNRAP